jgi:hypothetical protein
MVPVKGLGNSLTQCAGLGKIMRHLDPGDTLKQGQRTSDRAEKRNSHHHGHDTAWRFHRII